jgi:glycerophosphoryl diester phosphodiesterase
LEKIRLNRPFRILAHRGASGYAPENTFASFDLALTMQPQAIETDLRLTRDGVIAVFHDETVDRMTAGSGKVADLTYAELARLPIDGEHAGDHPPQHVPRVEELLDRYWGRVPLCLEIKAHGVIEPLVSLLKWRGRMDGHVEFTSFEADAAHAIQAALPGAKVGILVRDFEPATIARVAYAGFAEICPWVRAATPGKIQAARALGLSVRV